jgi:hypothetical protein
VFDPRDYPSSSIFDPLKALPRGYSEPSSRKPRIRERERERERDRERDREREFEILKFT